MSELIHILYVEDNETDVDLFEMSLNQYNTKLCLSLDVANTISEARDIFCTEKHSAVLIDWNLPDGYGLEFAEHIRKLSQETIIIFLSYSFTDDLIQTAQSFAPKACLEKGYSEAHIEKILNCIGIRPA